MTTQSEDELDIAPKADSIPARFMESLMTGRPDPLFRQVRPPEPSGERQQAHIDSQRGTF